MKVEGFSQFDEERIIREFFGDRKGRFLDVGAYDGVSSSNTRRLALNGWSGVLVEGSPLVFPKLMENTAMPSMICVFGPAKGTTDGKLIPFFYSSNPDWASSAIAEKAVNRSDVFMVAPVTPQMLAGWPYLFVSVDIEGGDLEFLSHSANLLAHAELVCFEHDKGDKDQILKVLASHGFERIVGETPANILVAK